MFFNEVEEDHYSWVGVANLFRYKSPFPFFWSFRHSLVTIPILLHKIFDGQIAYIIQNNFVFPYNSTAENKILKFSSIVCGSTKLPNSTYNPKKPQKDGQS